MITVTTWDTDAQEWVSYDYYTAEEVAERLQVHSSTIYKLARAGVARPYRSGGIGHYRADDVAAFYTALCGGDPLPPVDGHDGLPTNGRPATDDDLEGLR